MRGNVVCIEFSTWVKDLAEAEDHSVAEMGDMELVEDDLYRKDCR